jgi:hypothetical protein
LGNIFASDNKRIISKFIPSRNVQGNPLKSTSSGDINVKLKSDADKEKELMTSNAGGSTVLSTLTSYKALSPADQSEIAGSIEKHEYEYRPTFRKFWFFSAILSFCCGIILLIFSGVVYTTIETKVFSNLKQLLPIRRANFEFFNVTKTSFKFYAYDYESIASLILRLSRFSGLRSRFFTTCCVIVEAPCFD